MRQSDRPADARLGVDAARGARKARSSYSRSASRGKAGASRPIVNSDTICPKERVKVANDNIRNQTFIASYFEDLRLTRDTVRGDANWPGV